MFELPGKGIRYLYILIFCAVLAVPISGMEIYLRAIDSELSLFIESNDGQIILYVIVLSAIIMFTRLIAQDYPFLFLALYAANWRRSGKAVLLFAFLSLSVSTVLILVMLAAGDIILRERWWIIARDYVFPRVPQMILIAVVSAYIQEMVFRGFLLRYLRWTPSTGVTVAAILFSSFVFSFVHNLSNPGAWLEPMNIQLFVGLFLLGGALCVIYLVSGSMMVGVGLHAGFLIVEWSIKRVAIVQTSEWWMPANQDVRTAPMVWALFILLALVMYVWRRPLYNRFAIEENVVSGADLEKGRIA